MDSYFKDLKEFPLLCDRIYVNYLGKYHINCFEDGEACYIWPVGGNNQIYFDLRLDRHMAFYIVLYPYDKLIRVSFTEKVTTEVCGKYVNQIEHLFRALIMYLHKENHKLSSYIIQIPRCMIITPSISRFNVSRYG